MIVFHDPKAASYGAPGHPEASWRVTRSHDRLLAAGHDIRMPSVQASAGDVLSVHTARHWENVRRGAFQDGDTPFFPGIHETALVSLSGALSALNAAEAGTPGFSLMRPPGHHAGRERVSGFCYLNNMAICATQALGKGRRVAVLDVDVHHGDGTEEIALGRENWLVVSLHQSPLYPGTGLESRANCLNVPLPPGTDETRYLDALENALRKILDFKPDVLGVSAGFDTYKECPLAQFRLEKTTYRRMGRLLAETGLKRFALLEGGYAEALPVLIENFLAGFAG